MKIRLHSAVVIFLGSYLPLSVILLAQDFDSSMLQKPFCWEVFFENSRCVIPLQNPRFSFSFFLVCFFCFAITIFVLWQAEEKRTIIIKEAKYIPSELINYSFPYVVAFVNLEYHATEKIFGFLIFLAWMYWIIYKSDQIILNPILIALGWRLYNITYTFPDSNSKQNGQALSHDILEPGGRYKHATIQDVVIIRARKDRER